MPQRLYGLLLLAVVIFPVAMGCPWAGAQAITEHLATNRIQSVVVYSDRALVTRRMDQILKEGGQRLVFQDLPSGLLPESLRASAQGVTILAVNVKTKSGAESRATERRRIEEEIASLQTQLQAVSDNRMTLEESLEDLRHLGEGIASFTGALVRSPADAESYLPLTDETASTAADGRDPVIERLLPFRILDALEIRRQDLRGEVRAIRIREDAIEQQVQALTTDLEELGALADSESYEVTVDVNAEKQGQVILDLSYMIVGVSWRSVYDARYLEEEKKLLIAYQAMVKQRTGEDWTDVQLELTTSTPHYGGQPRRLQPWNLRLTPEQQPVPVAERGRPATENGEDAEEASSSESNGALFTFGSEAISSSPNGFLATQPNVAVEGVETQFAVQLPATIKSGESEEKVSIAEQTFDVDITRLSIPMQTPYAYLQASTTNSSDHVLIGGQANIFFGSNFLATSHIDTTLPGGRLELYLGPDPRIEVRRVLVSREANSPGLLSQAEKVSVRYRIELSSRAEDPLRVTIKDLIPVAADPAITVEKFESEPRASRDLSSGVLTWNIDLGANGTRNIIYSYQISFPKGRIPSGI